MSLLAAYTFNEKAAYDYSGNKNNAALNAITFVAGQNYGYAAVFAGAGSNHNVNFTPNNFTGLTAFTFFTSLNLIALPGSTAVIAIQGSAFYVKLNSSGNIVFNIGGTTVTSAATISTGWNTIGCVWDGTNVLIYINGLLDTNNGTASSVTIGNNITYIGAANGTDTTTVLNAQVDSIEFRSTGLTAGQIISLDQQPGGCLVNGSNTFQLGDIIASESLVNTGVVTWVVSKSSFYFYPTSAMGTSYMRVGSIFSGLRQYYLQVVPDFDGNGNGQMNASGPISGLADLKSLPSLWTVDYRGFIQTSGGTIPYVWYSETQERYGEAGVLTSIYQETLVGKTFQANGSYCTFNYTVLPVNNSNAKTIYVKFGPGGAEMPVVTITVPTGSADPIYISGQIKMTSIKALTASFSGQYYSASVPPVYFNGTLSGINFNANNLLILQLLGVAYADLAGINGDGMIYPVLSF